MKTKLSWSWITSKRLMKINSPLFEEGNIICCLATKHVTYKEDVDDLLERKQTFNCGIGTCDKSFQSLAEYESHYNSIHRNVCSICRRFYPSSHLLDIHLLEWHDSMFELMAEKQHMFQCLIPTCSMKLANRKQRKNHMIKVHRYPSNFRFDREKTSNKSSNTNKKGRAPITMETTVNTNKENKQELLDKIPCGTSSESTSMETERDNSNDLGLKLQDKSLPVTLSESMSMETEVDKENRPKLKFSYRVPQNFSFGHGVSKGFQRSRGRGRGSKAKHWHNQLPENKNTEMDIENIDMNDLNDALNTT
ncbi:zinc finger protein 511-like [Mytilus edulis]|uniref:zinc finger protein 511-like n=1 Tax=Mytilus edulis TaxID=6550 RepID=UPI0039EF8911